MRAVTMALVLVGMLAAPSPGVINVKLVVDDDQLAVGQITTMHIMAQGTTSGVYSLSGDVVANPADPILLASISTAPVWSPWYNPPGFPGPARGMPGPNGGWINWGTQQTDWLTPDPTLGQADFVEIFSYQIQATAPGPGDVHLSIVLRPVGSYRPFETDKTAVMGTLTGVTIHVPEPVTLALLTLGGLLVARRRL